MRMTILALCLAALVAGGCLTTEPSEARLGEVFELAPHQSVRIGGTDWTIGFRGVSEDTRCPVDLACLAAGDAQIQLDIFGADADNPILLSASAAGSSWNDGHYRVAVVDLIPAPAADRVIQPEDYRVRLVVEALGP